MTSKKLNKITKKSARPNEWFQNIIRILLAPYKLPKINFLSSNFGRKIQTGKILWVSFVVVILCLSVFNLSFYLNLEPNITYNKVSNIDKKIQFWNSFLAIHPDYFEGWMELYKLESKKGQLDKAALALDNARKLNPNSEELKTVLGLQTSE